MITLTRDGIVIEVATELQASVFERSGYKRVEQAPDIVVETTGTPDKATAPNAEPEPEPPVRETKRRSRKKTTAE